MRPIVATLALFVLAGCGSTVRTAARPARTAAAPAPTVMPKAHGYRLEGHAALTLDATGVAEDVHFRLNRDLPTHSFDATAAARGSITGMLDLHGIHREGRAGRHCYRSPIHTDLASSSAARPAATARLTLQLRVQHVAGVVRGRVVVAGAQARWKVPRDCG